VTAARRVDGLDLDQALVGLYLGPLVAAARAGVRGAVVVHDDAEIAAVEVLDLVGGAHGGGCEDGEGWRGLGVSVGVQANVGGR
jgi:hypothetical protein